jgi:hypothetical protein
MIKHNASMPTPFKNPPQTGSRNLSDLQRPGGDPYFSKLGCLSTKYGSKTIFGVSKAFFCNVYSVYQYQDLILFQIVNTKYIARRQTGTVIEVVI